MKALELMDFFEIGVEGIIHVGANIGQEREAYRQSGAETCLYVEPVGRVFAKLQQNIRDIPGHRAINAACSDVNGDRVALNIASNASEASSLLPLGAHASLFPGVVYVEQEQVTTRSVDHIISHELRGKAINLLVIDTQGTELKVLRGAQFALAQLDAVFVEVSEVPLYEGGCTLFEIINFLNAYGFRMKWMEIGRHSYGDAFFLRSSNRPIPTSNSPNLALGKPAMQSSLSEWSSNLGAQGGNNGERTGLCGFHTDYEPSPWWQVDLGADTPIREIRVYNRMDIAADRARSLTVKVSHNGCDWEQVYQQGGHSFGGIDGRPLRRHFEGLEARYVRLQLVDTQYFHLDEVEVY